MDTLSLATESLLLRLPPSTFLSEKPSGIGLAGVEVFKLKKNTPKFRPSDNSIEKKNIFNFCQTSSSVKNITGCQIRRRDHIAKFNEASWIQYFVRPDDKTPVFVGCIKA